MAVSLDSYLRSLSYDRYYLKNSSAEVGRIDASVASMIANLKSHFGARLKTSLVFGSYERDTILPRSIDEKSDVDILVVFNHSEYERTPETYRNWLVSFANANYREPYGSHVVKTFPTVTIRLSNINYDLVPAKEEQLLSFGSTYYIPDKLNEWRDTNPKDVKEKVTSANTRFGSIVKPIIRLMKAWNAFNGYPFDSYEMEREIADMYFAGDTIQSGFFYVAKHLSTDWSATKENKLTSLRYNLEQVENYLDSDNLDRAKHWLHRVLPT